jgi:outer membrane lipoprotein SlyB
MLLLALKNARITTIQNNKQPVGVIVGLAVGKPVVGVALGLAKGKDRA